MEKQSILVIALSLILTAATVVPAAGAAMDDDGHGGSVGPGELVDAFTSVGADGADEHAFLHARALLQRIGELDAGTEQSEMDAMETARSLLEARTGTQASTIETFERLEAATALVTGQGGQTSNPNSEFATASELLSLQASLAATTHPEALPAMQAQKTSLDHAAGLIEHLQPTADATASDSFQQGIQLAQAATHAHAQRMGLELSPNEFDTGHALPSQAILALLEQQGTPITPDLAQEAAKLDDLPEPLRAALTSTIDAFTAYDAAATSAYGHGVDPGATTHKPSSLTEVISAPGSHSTPHTPALGELLSARDQLLEASLTLNHILGENDPPATSTTTQSTLNLCPTLALDLAGTDDTYTQDCALIIDAGGNDTYHNNAGGSGILEDPGCAAGDNVAAAVIDLNGDDTYGDPGNPRSCGANGGGFIGAGFLLDLAGNDRYNAAGQGTNGGGFQGTGILLDAAGNDEYTAQNEGTNGGGVMGTGLLIDATGHDTYTAGNTGTNGGGFLGTGTLWDATGTDTYTAGDEGVNGGAILGTGLLIDASGTNDAYTDDQGGSGTDRSVAPKGSFGAQLDTNALPGGTLRTQDNPDGTCTLYSDENDNTQPDPGETIITLPCPEPRTHQSDDGSITIYDDKNDDHEVDDGEGLLTTPPTDPGDGESSFQERELLHQANLTLTPAQDLPPEEIPGQDIPDVPATNGTETPDHEGTERINTTDYPGTNETETFNHPGTNETETTDHNGTEPIPTPDHNGTNDTTTPEIGQRIATVTVHDDTREGTEVVCVSITPENSPTTEVGCFNRLLLGPADQHVERGDTELVVVDPITIPGTPPQDIPDVPATPGQEIPDIPGTPPVGLPPIPATPPQEIPDVPATPGQEIPDIPPTPLVETPDVPGIEEGELLSSPERTVTIDATYRYSEDQVDFLVEVGGVTTYAPVPPSPAGIAWWSEHATGTGLTVTATLYEDGERAQHVQHTIPFIGQALRAAEKTTTTA